MLPANAHVPFVWVELIACTALPAAWDWLRSAKLPIKPETSARATSTKAILLRLKNRLILKNTSPKTVFTSALPAPAFKAYAATEAFSTWYDVTLLAPYHKVIVALDERAKSESYPSPFTIINDMC